MARVQIIEIEGRNLDTGQDETLCFSRGGYMSLPTDTPPNRWYPDLVQSSLNFERTLFDTRTMWGQSKIGQGVLKLANGDGQCDYLERYSFDGRIIRILDGDDAGSRADFVQIFRGTVENHECGMDEVVFRLRDRLSDLDTALQTNLYGGTNSGPTGVDGLPGDLKDKQKPVVVGFCRNVPVTMVNTSLLIGQVHDGSAQSITNPCDRGSAQTLDPDVADLAALQAVAVAGGHMATCNRLGLVKYGTKPGKPTVDVQGDNTGGYVQTTATVLARLLTRYGKIPGADLKQAQFDALTAVAPGVVGLYISRDRTVLDACDDISASALAWYSPDAAGLFGCGRLRLPVGPGVATIDEILRDPRLSRQPSRHTDNGLPAWRVTIKYQRNWCVMDESTIASGVSAERTAWLKEEWRTVAAEDATIKTAYPHATEIEIETCLDAQADAQALADLLLAIVRVRRDFWQVGILPEDTVGIDLADDVTLQQPRLGLDLGKPFIASGIKYDYGLRRAVLTLWG